VVKITVAPKQTGAARIEVDLPTLNESASQKPEAKEVSVRAESSGRDVGTIELRVELRKRTLPE
jgi:hypothetical protein